MENISIDLSKRDGLIKPMNAVNNGPVPAGVRKSYNNGEEYKALEIPYARNHDASFYIGYGGEHTVDVHRIFKDFSADENDPKSYIFEPTDKYTKSILDVGTKVYYRLGASIEHGYKYGTRVPEDFSKWARICEHIIRHYTEGWADGFYYDIEYWEIWNEPDCRNADGSNPCWQGTEEQFIEFYSVVSKHLKSCFPKLKIGGPAFMTVWSENFVNKFLNKVVEDKLPLDFFSYHWYGKELKSFEETVLKGEEVLEKHGLVGVETILNEWNYVKGWLEDEWFYTLKSEKNIKGASFVAGAMCIGQALPLDMLVYYDARPCTMNGLFKNETFECLKPYYAFAAFRELRKLGEYIPIDFRTGNIFSCAAGNYDEAAVMLTYYDDNDDAEIENVIINIKNPYGKLKAEVYILDEENDLRLISGQYFTADEFEMIFDMKLFTTMLIKFKKL